MTEKEFENLKVGDKVWVIDGWWEQCVHEGKIRSINEERKTFEIKDNKRTFHNGEVFHSKIEAREALVKHTKDMYAYEVKLCGEWHDSVIKAEKELAKAKEEEEVVWTVDFDEGKVVRSTKRRWEGSVENYEWSLGSPRYKPCDTEREAYEALADYYKGKYEEALVKSGRYSWAVGNNSETGKPKIFAAMNNGGEPKGYLEDVVRCPSLQEAEAELERRKRND